MLSCAALKSESNSVQILSRWVRDKVSGCKALYWCEPSSYLGVFDRNWGLLFVGGERGHQWVIEESVL